MGMFGLGLRSPHHSHVLQNKPKVDFFEVHTENFIADGGASLDFLSKISAIYPLSFHSVGISLGSAGKLNSIHLKRIKSLIDQFKPLLLSDHLSWSNSPIAGVGNDLLPIPYTKESLQIFCDNVKEAQDYFGRQILVENPSAYLEYKITEMSETDFLNELVKQSGCALLLDINNIYVSCRNFNLDAKKYLQEIDAASVKEIHLAGHSIHKYKKQKTWQEIRIDTHNTNVCDDVLELYKLFAKKNPEIPTLIEWDQDIPKFEVLYEEMEKARLICITQL